MSTIEKDDIKAILHEVFEERSRIDAEIHADHHAFIALMIEKKERQTRIVDKLIEQVLGWGLISILGFFGYQFLVNIKDILISILNKMAK